ncbi:MAG: glycoside hydrolase family 172 protein [Planctomycetota bacterium]
MDRLSVGQVGTSARVSTGKLFGNRDAAHLAKGETLVVAELAGPGVINHIWMTTHSGDIRHPRALVLRIFWDGAAEPAVETPLGDFFAVGNGMRAVVNSLPVKVSSYGRGYNCYWQMPFRRSAKVTVTNESHLDRATLYAQVDWRRLPAPPADMMYFHARYHQEYPPGMCEPYTVFETTGRGHYVGTVLSSRNGVGHWFGEGDDFFYIDGEAKPSIFGTGTEDYFNEAWNMRVHSGAFTGCTVFEPRARDARISAYRWHITDPVIFKKSLRFEIERTGYILDSAGKLLTSFGHRPDYWSSVSFWYQDEVAKPWCPFPPYRERIAEEVFYHLYRIVKKLKHSAGVELQVHPYNRATWFKSWFRAAVKGPGEWLEIPFTIPKKGCWSMSLFQHLRDDGGVYRVLIDGKEIHLAGDSHIAGGYRVSLVRQIPPDKVNKTLDFYNLYRRDEHEDIVYGQRRERKLGLFHFEPGEHRLRLVCVGANPLSREPGTDRPGYNLCADVLSLRLFPQKEIDTWLAEMMRRMQAAPGKKR